MEARVDVQVNPVNDAPEARDESYEDDDVFFLNGTEDIPLSIPVAELLKNDRDVDGLVLTLASVTGSVDGLAEIQGDGTILFTPD